MEHRKRNRRQQKVELSTLLRIVTASRKNASFRNSENPSQNLAKALAYEAMEYLKDCDHSEIDIKSENMLTESRFAI